MQFTKLAKSYRIAAQVSPIFYMFLPTAIMHFSWTNSLINPQLSPWDFIWDYPTNWLNFFQWQTYDTSSVKRRNNLTCHFSLLPCSVILQASPTTFSPVFVHFNYSLCYPYSRRKLEDILYSSKFHKITYGYNRSFISLKNTFFYLTHMRRKSFTYKIK